jgi:hypothetical protein
METRLWLAKWDTPFSRFSHFDADAPDRSLVALARCVMANAEAIGGFVLLFAHNHDRDDEIGITPDKPGKVLADQVRFVIRACTWQQAEPG